MANISSETNKAIKLMRIFFISLLLLTPFFLVAQNEKLVTGVVMDESNQPLIGVSVMQKGTTIGTLTNIDGNYSIKVSLPATLIYSYLGMEPKEIRVTQSHQDVILRDNPKALDEVVVTGYQTISKERATGSFDLLKSEEITTRSVSDVSKALEGVVAGLQAKTATDGTVEFLIRGASSLYADRKPLIVVDGFPVQDNFSNINPNDVESITVLKDAAAASIWGARSANGVIVVTTKKGRNNERLDININSFVSVSPKMDLDQILITAGSSDHIRYERLAFENNWMPAEYTGSFSEMRKPLTLAQEYLFAHKNGKISAEALNDGLNNLSKLDNKEQIRENLLRKKVLQQYSISLSRGGAKSQNYLSLLFEKDLSYIKENSYNRWIANFNNSYDITRWLTLNLGATLQQKNETSSGATLAEISQLSPYEMLLTPTGSYSSNIKDFNREQVTTIPLNKFVYNDWDYNLLQEVNSRTFETKRTSLRLQAGLKFKIYEGLTFETKFQYEDSRTNVSRLYHESSYFTRNRVNFYTEYNSHTKDVGNKYLPKGAILNRKGINNQSFVFRTQLNYNKTIKEDHNISVLIGSETSNFELDENTYQTVYGFDPKRNTSSFPSYGYDKVKNVLNSGYETRIPGSTAQMLYRNDRYLSVYANIGYNFKGRYGVSFSMRSDASNLITDDPAGRWAPLWSVGGMWNIAYEPFMKDLNNVNRLTLRLTYGKNGNVEKSTSPQPLISMNTYPSSSTGTITASISSYGNPSLRWEVTNTVNLGVDFALFGNKLVGKIDVYNKRGSNIIASVEIPSANGIKSQRFNNAAIRNRGVELELGSTLSVSKVSWSPTVTYSYNTNKILSLYRPNMLAREMLHNGAFVEGAPISPVYSYTYLGMIDGVPHIAGADNKPVSMSDAAVINLSKGVDVLNFEGTTIPPHTLGWNNRFRWKDFDLSFLFIAEFGAKLRMPVFNYPFVGSNKTKVDKYVSDIFNGSDKVPGFPLPNDLSFRQWSRFIPSLNTITESASYLSCKEVAVGYSLSGSILQKTRINKLRVFAQAKDLGLIWAANSKGYDPNWLPGAMRPGITYTVGFNVQF